MRASTLRLGMNAWPPFLFAGIRLAALSDDFRHAHVRMRQHWFNRNYVGTHFGGSLFAMTDPFWMLLTMRSLGRDYMVWDQAGEIRFVKPGRGTVEARFDMTDEVLDRMRAATTGGAKYLHWFDTDIVDAAGDVVATVRKQVYVRRKQAAGNPAAA
jgi:acyl-coenzyme A thioesterase PaaI-like protein